MDVGGDKAYEKDYPVYTGTVLKPFIGYKPTHELYESLVTIKACQAYATGECITLSAFLTYHTPQGKTDKVPVS